MDEEQIIWSGHPSQLINLPVFFLCALTIGGLIAVAALATPPVTWILAGATVIPLGISVWRFVATRCMAYELTSERLRLSEGVLSRTTQMVELYRVKDYVLNEPILYRMAGLGNVVLSTTDDTNPKVVLRAVNGARKLSDEIRHYVEICRQKKQVRIAEIE